MVGVWRSVAVRVGGEELVERAGEEKAAVVLVRGQIGKGGGMVNKGFALEAALFEDVGGSGMFGMAERVEAPKTQVRGERNDGAESFRGVAAAPCVFGEDVTGGRFGGRLKGKAGGAEKLVGGAGFDEEGAGGPALPLRFTKSEKDTGVVNGLVRGPAQKAGDLRVAGITSENGFGVARSGLAQDEAGGLDALGGFHTASMRKRFCEDEGTS